MKPCNKLLSISAALLKGMNFRAVRNVYQSEAPKQSSLLIKQYTVIFENFGMALGKVLFFGKAKRYFQDSYLNSFLDIISL